MDFDDIFEYVYLFLLALIGVMSLVPMLMLFNDPLIRNPSVDTLLKALAHIFTAFGEGLSIFIIGMNIMNDFEDYWDKKFK